MSKTIGYIPRKQANVQPPEPATPPVPSSVKEPPAAAEPPAAEPAADKATAQKKKA